MHLPITSAIDKETQGTSQKGGRVHRVVHNALERLEEDQDVGGLAAGDPVIVVVLCQLIDLLQRQAGAHPAQLWSDVKALCHHISDC